MFINHVSLLDSMSYRLLVLFYYFYQLHIFSVTSEELSCCACGLLVGMFNFTGVVLMVFLYTFSKIPLGAVIVAFFLNTAHCSLK